MTAATSVSTQPIASAKDPVESAEPFFAELDPTGDLQAFRTRRQLICDFAVLCLEQMGKIYQSNYEWYSARQKEKDDKINSGKLKIGPPPLNSPDNDSVRNDCAKSKAILDHFNTRVRPNLAARRAELDKVYGEARMKDLLARCQFPGDLLNSYSPYMNNDTTTEVIPYIAQNLHLTHNANGFTKVKPHVANIIYPLVQIILGNDNVNLPHQEGCNITFSEYGVCNYKSTRIPSYPTSIGIGMQSLSYTVHNPILNQISNATTESYDVKTRIEFLPNKKSNYSIETFFATMQLALCVERRLNVKDLIRRTLVDLTSSGWNDLINIIMDYVPPPKSAIEIVELDDDKK